MSEDLRLVLIGSLMGLLSGVIGTLITHWLSVSHEGRKAKREAAEKEARAEEEEAKAKSEAIRADLLEGVTEFVVKRAVYEKKDARPAFFLGVVLVVAIGCLLFTTLSPLLQIPELAIALFFFFLGLGLWVTNKVVKRILLP